jgi:hypothetical protein
MEDVNRELVEVMTDDWWRRLDRARLPRLIALTDAMLEELEQLEQLNLADVPRVSAEWRERLVLLFANLPFKYRPRVRAFPSPTEVLDVIVDVQERLFALRNDAGLELGSSAVEEPPDAQHTAGCVAAQPAAEPIHRAEARPAP